MKYLQPINEFFGFGKKNNNAPDDKASWQDKLEYIKAEFERLKNPPKDEPFYILNATERSDNNVGISYRGRNIDIHLEFYKREDGYEVTDFAHWDGEPKSKAGNEDITEEDYKKASEFIKIVSEWLDEKSENEYNKSDTTISDEGNINFDEGDLALDELNYKLEDMVFGKYLDKSFEFELSYYLWSETSKNERIVERKNLTIKDQGRLWWWTFLR